MCGIGGIYLPDGVSFTPALKESLGEAWVALSDRGIHASGFSWSWLNADSTHHWKAPISSVEAVECGVLGRAGLMVRSMLLHTRYTTQGSTSNNGNNHPVVRDGITLTHNGVIWNDYHAFNRFGVKRDFEVDTESLIVALRYGGVEWLNENMQGSYSLAWVDDTDSTQIVNLITNGRNPLVIGRTVEGAIVWASNLYHLDSFNLESSFNALPFKHYRLNPSGFIESKWTSDEREAPTVFTRATHSHSASYGACKPRNGFKAPTPARKVSKAEKGRSKARNQHPRIEAGWVYDENSKGWRKARASDYVKFD